jgi:SAM-dependent methyltransferase
VVDRFLCRICGQHAQAPAIVAREMMHGTRREFVYRQCSACGCLQIERYPDDMAPFYERYYSHRPKRSLREHLIRQRDLFEAGSGTRLGGLLALRWPNPTMRLLAPILADRRKSVLDVGCGWGSFLHLLKAHGFSDLCGIDPYLDDAARSDGQPRIVKGHLGDLQERYDLVFLSHSLEHMPHQTEVLAAVTARLREGGLCILRIPLCSSWAWETYGVDWVGLDAPRHFYLHTQHSLRIAAERAGLVVHSVAFDSTGFQFWGSEQYRRDRPLVDPGQADGEIRPDPQLFDAARLRGFEAAAARLNASGRGDQAIFLLSAATPGAHRRVEFV